MKYEILKVNLFIEFDFIIYISSLNKLSIVKRFELFFKILLFKYKMINKEIKKLLLYFSFDDLFFKVYYNKEIIRCENYYYRILDIDHLIYD